MYNTQFNNIFPSLYFSHGIRVFVRDIWEKKIPWSSHQVAYSGDYTSCLASSLFRWVCAKTNTTIRFSKPPRLKPSQVFRQQMCHAPADTRVPVSAWVHVPVRARYSSQLLTIFFFCCCVRRLISRVPIYIRSHYGHQNTVFSEHFDIGDFISFPTYFSDFFSHTRSLFGDCSVPDLFPGKFTKKFWYIPSVRFLDRTFFHPSWLSDVMFLAPKNTGIRSASPMITSELLMGSSNYLAWLHQLSCGARVKVFKMT